MVQRSALEAEDDRLNRLAIDFLTPYQKRNRSDRWKGRFEVQKLYTLNQVRKCTSREALGAGEVLAASVDGKVECPLCFLETDPKKLLQHMAGHILENEVRFVCPESERFLQSCPWS